MQSKGERLTAEVTSSLSSSGGRDKTGGEPDGPSETVTVSLDNVSTEFNTPSEPSWGFGSSLGTSVLQS